MASKFTKSRTLLITHYLHAEHMEWSMNQDYINTIYTHRVTINAFLKLFLIITAAFVQITLCHGRCHLLLHLMSSGIHYHLVPVPQKHKVPSPQQYVFIDQGFSTGGLLLWDRSRHSMHVHIGLIHFIIVVVSLMSSVNYHQFYFMHNSVQAYHMEG